MAQFHPRGAGIRTSDRPITSPPAIPTEPQLPHILCCIYVNIAEIQMQVL